MERYNSRLEGYEAITALEVVEHLDPHILSRFGVVTMGTYRPRILLVTTPVSLWIPLPQTTHRSRGGRGCCLGRTLLQPVRNTAASPFTLRLTS